MRQLRKRKVRFPLIVEDNIKIRTLEELKEHPDLRAILSYYANGKLITWLRDRYSYEKADLIEELDKDSIDFVPSLLLCLGIESSNQKIELSEVVLNNEKLERVKRITDDKRLISEYKNFAFDDHQLALLLENSQTKRIYLYEGSFKMHSQLRSVNLIGIKEPCIDICDYSFNDLRRAGVKYNNIGITSHKLKQVLKITNDEFIISNFDRVAFNDDELDKLINTPDINQIWLSGDSFKLKSLKPRVTITGINIPFVDIGTYSFNDLSTNEVTIEHATKISEYFIRVKNVTKDKEILSNFECVAFDNERFYSLLQEKEIKKIYLFGDRFKLKGINHPVDIIGLNSPTIELGNYTFNELKVKHIKLTSVYTSSNVLDRVRNITDNEEIIENFENVAFDNNDLDRLVQNDKVSIIYLYGNNFKIPFVRKDVLIQGINSPIVELKKGKKLAEYIKNGISLLRVTFKDSEMAYSMDLSELSEGSSFTFGKYLNSSIEWIVAFKTNDFILAIAPSLDISKPLNSKDAYSWGTCSLRQWLNRYFFEKAFNSYERLSICNADLHTSSYSMQSQVIDNVFILSLAEYEKLNIKVKERLYGSWLRTQSYLSGRAKVVGYGGLVQDFNVISKYRVVPVIMLKPKIM